MSAVDVLAGFKPTPSGNVFLPRDGYGISYNANPCMGLSFFAGDGGAETAIVVDGDFFILNGDFRREYAELPTLADSLRFFASKPELVSSWSDSVDAALARVTGAQS